MTAERWGGHGSGCWRLAENLGLSHLHHPRYGQPIQDRVVHDFLEDSKHARTQRADLRDSRIGRNHETRVDERHHHQPAIASEVSSLLRNPVVTRERTSK